MAHDCSSFIATTELSTRCSPTSAVISSRGSDRPEQYARVPGAAARSSRAERRCALSVSRCAQLPNPKSQVPNPNVDGTWIAAGSPRTEVEAWRSDALRAGWRAHRRRNRGDAFPGTTHDSTFDESPGRARRRDRSCRPHPAAAVHQAWRRGVGRGSLPDDLRS